MKQRNLLATAFLRGATLLCPVVVVGGLAGCAGGAHEDLTLHPSGQDRTFVEQFSKGYLCRDGDGDLELVLVDRAAERHLDGAAASQSNDGSPVRQIMHLRVLWNPKRDQKADHSVASNSTVHWYVMGNTPGTRGDVLEYAGTAFVTMDDPDAQPAELTVRNASVHPVACRGGLCDPVGASTLSGTVHAAFDRRRVRAALDSVRSAIAAGAVKPESASSMAR